MRCPRPENFRSILRDALLVAIVTSVVAIVVDLARADGIPLVATRPYEIYVPCPEPVGEACELAPDDPSIRDPSVLLIDARAKEEYEEWHIPGAVNVEFDYLEPVSGEQVRKIASSGKRRVVVYGDGDDPDSGRELARELAGKGIRGVCYVRGGAPALRKGGGR